MLQKLSFTGKVTELLTSSSLPTTKELAKFLVKADETRRELREAQRKIKDWAKKLTLRRATSTNRKACICGKDAGASHILDECSLHRNSRSRALTKIGHIGRITELLASDDVSIIGELGRFLAEVEETIVAETKAHMKR